MSKQNVSEYTDRELLEKTAMFMKITADNTSFIKIYLIIMTVISVIGSIVLISELK